MPLETMRPDPVFDAESYSDTIETIAEHDDLTYIVWGGDWCRDCRSQLPQFGAALDAADVPDDRIEQIPVEKLDDGSKEGPKVEEYGIEYIPTVVVEQDGEEVARFVEEEPVDIAVYLADQIREYFGEN